MGPAMLPIAFDPLKNTLSSKNTDKLLHLLRGKARYDLTFYFVTRLANIIIGIYWNYVFSGSIKLRYSLTLYKALYARCT